MTPPPRKTNPIAEKLNAELEAAAPQVVAMLSAFGRRLYFPKGIISPERRGQGEGAPLQRDHRHRHRRAGPM